MLDKLGHHTMNTLQPQILEWPIHPQMMIGVSSMTKSQVQNRYMALVQVYFHRGIRYLQWQYRRAFTIQIWMHQLYSPPQLKHQYIDYTNGSSIVSGQKIHVDFDYGNGLDCRWLWKAILTIVGHHTLFVWLKNGNLPQALLQHLSTRKVLSDGGDEGWYQGFCLMFDIC